MLDELGHRRDLLTLRANVAQLRNRNPTPEELRQRALAAGFEDARIVTRELRLPYANASALFADRLLAYVAMDEWRSAASEGTAENADEILREAEHALATYFGGRALSLRVHAGLLVAGRAQHTP